MHQVCIRAIAWAQMLQVAVARLAPVAPCPPCMCVSAVLVSVFPLRQLSAGPPEQRLFPTCMQRQRAAAGRSIGAAGNRAAWQPVGRHPASIGDTCRGGSLGRRHHCRRHRGVENLGRVQGLNRASHDTENPRPQPRLNLCCATACNHPDPIELLLRNGM